MINEDFRQETSSMRHFLTKDSSSKDFVRYERSRVDLPILSRSIQLTNIHSIKNFRQHSPRALQY